MMIVWNILFDQNCPNPSFICGIELFNLDNYNI